MATGYTNTFITVAPDCPVVAGFPPPKTTSISGLEHGFLINAPYQLTGDDLIFAVYLRHKAIRGDADLAAIREAFFSKPHPCLRASALPKRYGWGAHYDDKGRIALYGMESAEYRRFITNKRLKILAAMRSRKST